MRTRLSQPWIPLSRIEPFLQIDTAIIILTMVIGAWLTYKIFLRKVSEKRHHRLSGLFKNLMFHLIPSIGFFLLYWALHQLPNQNASIERMTIYAGVGAIAFGATVFVKTCRIFVFEYFFLSHMRVPFPLLLVNLISLLLSIILATWITSEIFNFRLTPILATSAVFSLVVGLALQDTLGNLFAGVALQLDKPYEIGDWIEIQSGIQKWAGQVYEVSWRATILVGISEETITVPNRIMGQAQIANFSNKYRPFNRGLLFRLPFGIDIPKVKELLIAAARSVDPVRKIPAPRVIVFETNESWVTFKLIYFIDNYGVQFSIADQVYSKALLFLNEAGIQLPSHRVTIVDSNPEKNLTG